MRITIATTANTHELVDLQCELYEYYHPHQRADRTAISFHLSNTLLAPDSELKLVMARSADDKVMGVAAIHFVHSVVDPTPDGRKQCVLKELFVSTSHRGQNVGTQIMKWVATHALENGCGRIDWSVKSSNTKGIAFYTELGARHVEDRISYRLNKSAVMALVP